jgi:hypothetical protein
VQLRELSRKATSPKQGTTHTKQRDPADPANWAKIHIPAPPIPHLPIASPSIRDKIMTRWKHRTEAGWPA